MNPIFSPSVYINRRTQLQGLCTSGVALFLANNDAPMNYPANVYHYRQDSNFLYFFGLSIPNVAAVVDFDTKEVILFGDDFEIDDIIWMGDQPKMSELAQKIGVKNVQPYANLAQYLAGKEVLFTPPYRAENKIFLSELTGIPVADLKAKASVELIKAVVSLREIKSEEEIAQMEIACNLGVKMHKTVMRMTKPGMTEQQLFGTAVGVASSEGNGTSFPVILSQNGQTLHNHDHSGILEAGRLLLMDAGAENNMNYTSDYTRTLPVSGEFTPQQAAIYETVYQANIQAIAACKPGIEFREMHRLAVTVITEGLQKVGLMKGDVAKSVEAGAHALFMPHGLGHQIGLDVHDMEDLGENFVGYNEETVRSTIFGWASLRMGKTLQPGHVVTVEPGIYFIPHLIDIWKKENKFAEFINYEAIEAYRNFGGIRIEDDVLITETGHRVLGEHLPKSIEEIQNIMKG